MSRSDLVSDIEAFSYEGVEVGHDSGLYATVSMSEDFDNVVADINMVSSGLDQTTNSSYGSTEDFEDVTGTPFESLSEDGDLEVIVSPEENYRIMERLSEQATLYVPDHVMGCLPEALEGEFGGSGHYTRAEEIHDSIFEFLNFHAEPLQVKDRMGLERYSSSALESRHPEKSEDDFIIEAAEQLPGQTVIMTYDSDYLADGVTAASPKAVEQVLLE